MKARIKEEVKRFLVIELELWESALYFDRSKGTLTPYGVSKLSTEIDAAFMPANADADERDPNLADDVPF